MLSEDEAGELLDTLEYLERHHVTLSVSPYNLWISEEESFKIGMFSLAPHESQCPNCHASQFSKYYIPPLLVNTHKDRLFSLGVLLLEMACNTFIKEMINKVPVSLLTLKKEYMSRVMDSPLRQLIATLLDEPTTRAKYGQFRSGVQSSGSRGESVFSEGQIDFVSDRITRGKLDMERILGSKCNILLQIDLSNVQ